MVHGGQAIINLARFFVWVIGPIIIHISSYLLINGHQISNLVPHNSDPNSHRPGVQIEALILDVELGPAAEI